MMTNMINGMFNDSNDVNVNTINKINDMNDINKQLNDIIKKMNITSQNFVEIDLNDIVNVLSNKMNGFKKINEKLISQICINIIMHSKNHNTMINEWFDDLYEENLLSLKKNNNEYSKIIEEYENKSFITIKK